MNMDVKTALEYAVSKLSTNEADDDARYLLSHILQQNFTW